ncbi:MAG: GlsB/YeaQ/YmgE family stress response membrane protein [Solirubrobacterales bacterium]
MGVIGWVALGFCAGLIARVIIPGDKGPQGCIATTVIGILGALVGGFIASALNIGDVDEFFDLGTWLIAIGGSVILLLILGAITRK